MQRGNQISHNMTPPFISFLFYFIFEGSDEETIEISQNPAAAPQEGADKDGENVELKKQEMLVHYLTDTETFALQVEKAISIINTMLHWKTTSGKEKYIIDLLWFQ